MYAAKTLTLPFPVAIALAPFITVTIFAKVLRKNLHAIWDVCIVIRQARDTSSENPDIFVLAKNAVWAGGD
ncbi:hypothetical protein B484DRAFT_406486 [Ochromonadaceae sp. CCMP2298]|nr:hypothetical protein B484DRAFT_406486 [Ochromonadaceae sp. CCMP2298]